MPKLSLKLKLGTRKSLLAWAQSSWVAREVERLNPGVHVELVGIETRGDQIQHIPLSKAEGKEFFVAEIDEALASGKVDFTVHSLKDLSLERPSEFVCTIPKRENPRDVILFGPRILENLGSGVRLKIGTSSPRRLENIPKFLHKALPVVPGRLRGEDPSGLFEFVEIRGNVNTRLGRVHEKPESERYLDGVVLAFAGLIRLWNDSKGRQELTHLLKGVRWMILPLRECPAAPAQGALAVECRKKDSEVLTALQKLHDPGTYEHVSLEREILGLWGGGCHQRLGATAISQDLLGNLLYIRGVKPDGAAVEELRWNRPALETGSWDEARVWDGASWRVQSEKNQRAEISASFLPAPETFRQAAVFIAHSRALPEQAEEILENSRTWTSGVSSWFRLASRGVWVEGCTEGFGFLETVPTFEERVLQLPPLEKWKILTHRDAADGWEKWNSTVIPTYEVKREYSKDAKEALKKATHIFWSSGSQFDELKEWVPVGARHACGAGKTAKLLNERGLSPRIFPSVEEWRKWLKRET